MIYLDDRFRKNMYGEGSEQYLSARNKAGEYSHCLSRELLVQEIKTIFEAQRNLGNEIADEGLEREYLEIMLSQRSFDLGPGNMPNGKPSPYAGNLIEKMVGYCTLERTEKRAAKATFTAERFVLFQAINHTHIIDEYGNVRSFTDDEKEKIVNMAYSKGAIQYKDIRKLVHLNLHEHFNGLDYGKKNCEEKKFIAMKYWKTMSKLFELNAQNISKETIKKLDDVGTILSCFKSDDVRKEKLTMIIGESEIIQQLLELEYDGFLHLSLKAMRKLLPYLENGFVYSEACEKAGYGIEDISAETLDKKLNGKYVIDTLNEITNPVVKRAVSQTIKVINYKSKSRKRKSHAI